jgi:hypothetical protein
MNACVNTAHPSLLRGLSETGETPSHSSKLAKLGQALLASTLLLAIECAFLAVHVLVAHSPCTLPLK